MDYGQLGLLIIALAGSVVLGLLVPYIRANTTKVQRDNIQLVVEIAVFAAEQIYKGPKMGTIKKQEVLDYLAFKGINLTDEDLDMLIEAAVMQLNLAYEQVFSD